MAGELGAIVRDKEIAVLEFVPRGTLVTDDSGDWARIVEARRGAYRESPAATGYFNVVDTRNVGAMRRLEYEASPKHGSAARGNVSAAPRNGQNAPDNSVQVKSTSPRRVGVDYERREFVVFDQTSPGKFHGHVRAWQQLTQEMKNALIKSGMANSNGKLQ